jgi:integrase
MMTFRGFIQKYRTPKLVNKKGTTVHGYETNIRAHYLPEFGPVQLSEIAPEAETDVERLLALKERVNGQEEDRMFPNRIKNGSIMKSGPISARNSSGRIQPVTGELGLPHITWRLLRHWGATQMAEANPPIKAVQQRLGHSRPNTVLIYYARVLDKSTDSAASLVSGQLSGAPVTAEAETSIISTDLPLVGSAVAASLPQ